MTTRRTFLKAGLALAAAPSLALASPVKPEPKSTIEGETEMLWDAWQQTKDVPRPCKVWFHTAFPVHSSGFAPNIGDRESIVNISAAYRATHRLQLPAIWKALEEERTSVLTGVVTGLLIRSGAIPGVQWWEGDRSGVSFFTPHVPITPLPHDPGWLPARILTATQALHDAYVDRQVESDPHPVMRAARADLYVITGQSVRKSTTRPMFPTEMLVAGSVDYYEL